MDENDKKDESLINKEKLIENEDSKKTDGENQDNKIQKKDSGPIEDNAPKQQDKEKEEKEIENLYEKFDKERFKVKKKIREISEYLIEKGEELYYLQQNLTNKKQKWTETIYKRCCCCECSKCSCCHCYCCCYKQKFKKYKEKLNNIVDEMIEKETKLEKIPMKLSNENIRNTFWIQHKNFKNFCFFISIEKLKYFCSALCFYFLTIFHFVALSEVHGILLVLFKEIERSLKQYIFKHYDFDKNSEGEEIIKDFYYYLTESNYHDSSQINFNYLSSMFTILVIKKFNTYYNIVFVYLISIVVVTIFSSILLSYDYKSKEQLKENDNYTVWKFIFGFIVPYVIIYTSAGFISLLPNKILDEIYSNKKLSGNLNKLIYINFCIGISVVIKNYINKFWIHSNVSSIYYILLIEILIFAGASSIYLLYLFLLLFITKRKVKKRSNSFSFQRSISLPDVKESDDRSYTFIRSINIDNSIEDFNLDKKKLNPTIKINQTENNENYSIYYLGGYFFIKTNSIYSFITIKGFGNYILSVFKSKKLWLILFLNLCSRIQKLKFKTEYKSKIENIHLLFFNFIFSILFIVVLDSIYLIYITLKKQKFKNQSIENFIMVCLCISFSYVMILSIIFYITDSEPISLYISIVITGSLNYLLNFYYSTQSAEYISLSGIISLSQILFRLIEFSFEPFEKDNDYFWQISFSIAGIISAIIYIKINK